ncbi:MAG: Rpn family recombination-promoting nuclease/putative transposase [Bacteroidales bacterium]|jgi:predicted transposase/invertase (TIGR01784 family)|nr:Rpn family recombination-promoting nuclease/putative transposase [Bacteroidales bacterium]
MAHYLDPKNDLTFKRVFGEHKHLCMSLINSMLPLEKPVASIEYQTGELIPELANVLRHTVVDVRCTDEDGRQFIVEMQMYWTDSFRSRVLLNASKAYVRQLDKAGKFELLHPVYALSFVNDTFEKTPEMANEYWHHYKIVNIKDTGKQIRGLEFVFVELPKFHPQNRAEKKLRDLWLRFLTEINESTEEIPCELLDNKLICEAVGYMESAAYTKEQLFTYDKWKIDIMTEKSALSDARGEGLKEGLKEGKREEKTEIALNMLRKGISVDDISEMTGLSKEQIEKL